jgi:hypothetical protein
MENHKGAEVLAEALALITGDRQQSYSHPLDDYQRTVAIFKAVTGIELTVEQGILFMIGVKLSRLAHELETKQWNPENTRDAAGYLGCLQMVREKKNVTAH